MTFEALLQAIVRGELRVRLYENRLRYRLNEGFRPGEPAAKRGEALVYALAEHHDRLLVWLVSDKLEAAKAGSSSMNVKKAGGSTATDRPKATKTSRSEQKNQQTLKTGVRRKRARRRTAASRQRYGLSAEHLPKPRGDSANEADGNPKIQPGFRGKRTAHRLTSHQNTSPLASVNPDQNWMPFQQAFSLEASFTAAYRQALGLPPVRHVAWVRAPISLSASGLQSALAAWAQAFPAITAYRQVSQDASAHWCSGHQLSEAGPQDWYWTRWLPKRPYPPLSEACTQALIEDWAHWCGVHGIDGNGDRNDNVDSGNVDDSGGEGAAVWSQMARQAVTLCLMPLVADAEADIGSSVAGYAQRAWAFDALGAVLAEGAFGDGKLSLAPTFQGERYALALICDDLLFCAQSSQALADTLSVFLMHTVDRPSFGAVRSAPPAAMQVDLPRLSLWSPQAWATEKGLRISAAIQVAEQWLDGLWMAVPDANEADSLAPSTDAPQVDANMMIPNTDTHRLPEHLLSEHLVNRLTAVMSMGAGFESRWLDVMCFAAMVQVSVTERIWPRPVYWVPIRYPVDTALDVSLHQAATAKTVLEKTTIEKEPAQHGVTPTTLGRDGVLGRMSGSLPVAIAAERVNDPFALLSACALGLEQVYQIGAHDESALLSMGPQSLPFALASLRAPVLQLLSHEEDSVALAQQAQGAPVRFVLDTRTWSAQVLVQAPAGDHRDALENTAHRAQWRCASAKVVAAWIAALTQFADRVLAHPMLQTLLFPGYAAERMLSHRSVALPFPVVADLKGRSGHCSGTQSHPGAQSLLPSAYACFSGGADDCYVLDVSGASTESGAFQAGLWRQAVTELTESQPALRSMLVMHEGSRLWGVGQSSVPDFQLLNMAATPTPTAASAVGEGSNGCERLHTLLRNLMVERGSTAYCVRHRLIQVGMQQTLAVLLVQPGVLDRYSALRLLKLIWRRYCYLLSTIPSEATADAASSSVSPASPCASARGASYALPEISNRTFLGLLQAQLARMAGASNSALCLTDAPQAIQHASLTLPRALCEQLHRLAARTLLTPEVIVRTVWAWCLRMLLPERHQLMIDVGCLQSVALGQSNCLGPWHASVRYWIPAQLHECHDLPALALACECTATPLRLGSSVVHTSRVYYARMTQFAGGVPATQDNFPQQFHHSLQMSFQSLHASAYHSDLHVVEAEGVLRVSLSLHKGAFKTRFLLNRLAAVLSDVVAEKLPADWQTLLPWERYLRQVNLTFAENQRRERNGLVPKNAPASALAQWRYAARALEGIRARAIFAGSTGHNSELSAGGVEHRQAKFVLSATLSHALTLQAERMSAVLQQEVAVADLVATAFFSCLSVFYAWPRQIVIDTLSADVPTEYRDTLGQQFVLPLAVLSGFFLPLNWGASGRAQSLMTQIGLLKRLMHFATAHAVPYQVRADLVADQRYRFFWQAHTQSASITALPAWLGPGLPDHLSVCCVTQSSHRSPGDNSQDWDARHPAQAAIYVESPDWAAPANEWVARLEVCLTAMASARPERAWHAPSPLLAQEVNCLRRSLAGARRIAKWPPLLSLLEQQILRTPMAPALHLVEAGLTLSYEQLSCLANWLAHRCTSADENPYSENPYCENPGAQVSDRAETDRGAAAVGDMPPSAIVCWQLSHGQVMVAILAALKLQVPFLILADSALPDNLPQAVLAEHAIWITCQPAALEPLLARHVAVQSSASDINAAPVATRVLGWLQSEWRDGSREDTPRILNRPTSGEPILTWAIPVSSPASSFHQAALTADVMPITREAFMNQLMATTRDLSLGPQEVVLLHANMQSAQMLQLLVGAWLYGGEVRLSATEQPSECSPEVRHGIWPPEQFHTLLSQQRVTWVQSSYSLFCDTLLLACNGLDDAGVVQTRTTVDASARIDYSQDDFAQTSVLSEAVSRLVDAWSLKNVLLHVDVGMLEIVVDALGEGLASESTTLLGDTMHPQVWARARVFQLFLLNMSGRIQVRFHWHVGAAELTVAQCAYDELVALNRPCLRAPVHGQEVQLPYATPSGIWPRWIDNLQAQVLLPDGRQAPPTIAGALQVSWPSLTIPAQYTTGDVCAITPEGTIALLTPREDR